MKRTKPIIAPDSDTLHWEGISPGDLEPPPPPTPENTVDTPRIPWPDPTPEMLDDPAFEAIWQVIKTWDINVPNAYVGYCGATGNHVRAILEAVRKVHT